MKNNVPVPIYETTSEWEHKIPSGINKEDLFLWGANLCNIAAYEWGTEDPNIVKEYSSKFLTTAEIYSLLYYETKAIFHIAPKYVEGYAYPNNRPIFFDNKKSTKNKIYFMTDKIYYWFEVEDITDEIDGETKTFANITYCWHRDTRSTFSLIDDGLPGVACLNYTDSLSKA